MRINIKPGRYTVAVSGGVDSVVLLDLLAKESSAGLLAVAHYDHGIRPESAADRKFVQKLAQDYGAEFFYEEGGLGLSASEALAREKRYGFLKNIQERTGSAAIITAHHQDDLIETMAINLLRGTGRKGLSSLSDRPGLLRPLLDFPKSELIAYAEKNGLIWREDRTNEDPKFLRNRIRHVLAANLSPEQREAIVSLARGSKELNAEIDMLVKVLFLSGEGISRDLFVSLDHRLASEVIAGWLRSAGARLDKKTIERIVISLKVSPEDKIIQTGQNKYFIIQTGIIRLNTSGPV